MNRRNFLKNISALTLVYSSTSILFSELSQAGISHDFPYKIYPEENYISRTLGNCEDIEREIEFLKNQLLLVNSNKSLSGMELRDNVNRYIEKINKKLKETEREKSSSQKEIYIQGTLSVIGFILLAISIYFKGVIVAGLVTGVSLLLIPIELVAHVIIKKDNNDPSILLGYSGDKILALGDVITESAKSLSGRIINKLFFIFQLALDLSEILSKKDNIDKNMVLADNLRNEILAWEKLISSLGSSPIRWANLKKNALESTIQSLEKYIENTKQFNCQKTIGENIIRSLP